MKLKPKIDTASLDEDALKTLRAAILLQPQFAEPLKSGAMSEDQVFDGAIDLINNGYARLTQHPDNTIRLELLLPDQGPVAGKNFGNG